MQRSAIHTDEDRLPDFLLLQIANSLPRSSLDSKYAPHTALVNSSTAHNAAHLAHHRVVLCLIVDIELQLGRSNMRAPASLQRSEVRPVLSLCSACTLKFLCPVLFCVYTTLSHQATPSCALVSNPRCVCPTKQCRSWPWATCKSPSCVCPARDRSLVNRCYGPASHVSTALPWAPVSAQCVGQLSDYNKHRGSGYQRLECFAARDNTANAAKHFRRTAPAGQPPSPLFATSS